jgi:Ca-activated chloride channel family protein
MSFIWPFMLLSLALIPIGLLLVRFVDSRRRRRVAAIGGAGLAQGGSRVSHRRGALRKVPAVLVLGGLVAMSVALARPQAVVSLPRQEGTVILAIDVSASMAATDLAPTRIAAAKAAAKDFVTRQPSGILVGVVAFSDSGVSVQNPTDDQATILSAINRLTPQHGTALAQGIDASLKAIAVAEAGPWANDYYTNPTAGASPTPAATPTPVPAGTHTSAAIVLLSDGENNENPNPATAAQTAANEGVRIYTVGIGSVAGTTVNLNGFMVHTQLDQATLQQISTTTGGTYYAATDAGQLRSVYDNLDLGVVIAPQMTEITALVAGLGLLLLLAGAATSLVWLGRLP